jgi:predicted Fe-Mo cluster-binding NifX family protein
MIVAIPTYQGAVAPCFEVARTFYIIRVEDNRVCSETRIDAGGCEGFGRIQLLKDRHTDVLICNGIKRFYRDLLQATGILIVSEVSESIQTALADFLHGKLTPDNKPDDSLKFENDVPLDDLICWTRELFRAHGYAVSPGHERAPFPIDLIAEISCPICAKKIRVAICCGAHTYRPEQEIQLLHQVTTARYDAKVYVHNATAAVQKCCAQYGVELIDPDARFATRDQVTPGRIPLLQAVVAGHETAFEGKSSQSE